MSPKELLDYYVTGAIERGEATAIVEQRADKTERVIAALIAADGAILCWQVPHDLAGDFARMNADDEIKFDSDTDMYVHEDAEPFTNAQSGNEGYALSSQVYRDWYKESVGYDPMADDPTMTTEQMIELARDVAQLKSEGF